MAKSSNDKKDRLAAALKENLKRRKAQARAKAGQGPPAAHSPGTPHEVGLEGAASPKSAPNRN
jgi:hypothetical protein